MTQRWFTELLLLHIPIILIPTQGIIPEWGWRGERRDLHWALGPEATGAIAIGATATSTSTTIITSTETPTETSTAVKLARATGGSTTRNTGAMLPMGTGKRRINSAVRVLLIALVAGPEHDPVAGGRNTARGGRGRECGGGSPNSSGGRRSWGSSGPRRGEDSGRGWEGLQGGPETGDAAQG